MAAKRAFTRARLEDAKPIEKQDAVLTAILFSAAALEAYINETFQIIRGMPALWQSSNKVSAFADVLDEAEEHRASPKLKYLLAKIVLTGTSFDKGALPYQDFDLLMAMRDELMHYKLQRIEDTHKIVERLKSRKIQIAHEPNVRVSWTSVIATPDVAKWACNTAASMINTIQQGLFAAVPAESDPSMLHFLAGVHYTPIEER